MSYGSFFKTDFFPTLGNREQFFESLTQEQSSGPRIVNQFMLMLALSFLYGCLMGAYHSFYQALSAGLKVATLFALVILICFPAFYIIQFILGSKLRAGQMIAIILSGFVLTTAIMISFAPIVVIFLLTGSNYYFLQLLHIGIFIFAGIFGMIMVVDALKYSCDKKSIYPQTGVAVFRFWVVILAFVGIQLAWNFRPFLGDRGEPFAIFREYEGNFYAALIYSAKQLIESDQGGTRKFNAPPQNTELDEKTFEEIFGDDDDGGKGN